MKTEIKQNIGDFDFKAKSDDKGERFFSGYLAYFGNVDSYGDIIEKGAFAEDLKVWQAKGYYPPVLEQHGGWGMSSTDHTPVGKFTVMREDDKGLYVEANLFSTTRGEDLYKLLKESPKGFMGMSIGYRTVRKEIIEMEDGSKMRILKELKLMEGSIVTFPANEEARIEDVKSNQNLTVRQVENILKNDCALSKKQSEDVISKLKQLGWPIVSEATAVVEDSKKEEATVEVKEDKSVEATHEENVNTALLDWINDEKATIVEQDNKKKLESLFDDIRSLIES